MAPLGQGAMGVVYKAFDPTIKRFVALKTNLLGFAEAQDDDIARRFHREAQAAANLNHQNIVGIDEYGEDAGRAFIAILAMAGCSHRAPTIARGHMGHAMTGWHNTPNKERLFVVAEKNAGEALKYAQAAADGSRNINQIKTDIERVSMLTNADAKGNKQKARKGSNRP